MLGLDTWDHVFTPCFVCVGVQTAREGYTPGEALTYLTRTVLSNYSITQRVSSFQVLRFLVERSKPPSEPLMGVIPCVP